MHSYFQADGFDGMRIKAKNSNPHPDAGLIAYAWWQRSPITPRQAIALGLFDDCIQEQVVIGLLCLNLRSKALMCETQKAAYQFYRAHGWRYSGYWIWPQEYAGQTSS